MSRNASNVVQLAGYRLPASSPWFILEVLRKTDAMPLRWTALLIDVDRDEYRAGLHPSIKSEWLDLGHHRSRTAAWKYAEQILAEQSPPVMEA